MTGSIPEATVEEIRARVDIVDLISEYVVLQKRGRNYLGLCPFHHEKTPSFTVTPEKQLFYCFGCGTGGNVFTFLMKQAGLTFPEAVARLAERAGVVLPDRGASSPEGEKVRRLLGLTELAARFYRHLLLHHPAAEPARRYLERRGVSPEVAERFRLGFAPAGPRALWQVLRQRGYSASEVREAGLLAGEPGEPLDRFRNRLMFPICDQRGRVVSFGGRVLDDFRPKYLNGPETRLFQKGKNIFALHLALPALRAEGRVLLTEGYMDVLSAHQHGITWAVASLGTSLTAEQAALLKRYVTRAVICYDGDRAGQAAAWRALAVLREAGLTSQVVTLPEGLDPDDYLRREGAEGFRRQVEAAQSAVEYRLERLLAERALHSVEDRVRMVTELRDELAGSTSPLERDEYVRLIAQRLGLAEEAVRAELWPRGPAGGQRKDKSGPGRHTKPMISSSRRLAEIRLLGWVLQDARLLSALAAQVGAEAFQDPEVREVAQALVEAGATVSAAGLASRLSEGARRTLAEASLVELPEVRDVAGTINELRRQVLQRRVQAGQEELRRLERQGEREAARDLLRRIAELQKEIAGLKADA